VYTALRVMAGLLFLPPGAQKILGVLGGFQWTPGAPAPLFTRYSVPRASTR
jgi:hypothetical protein